MYLTLVVRLLSYPEGIAASHQRRPGRPAYCLGIKMGESNTFLGHPIDVGRSDRRGAKAAEILVTLVIGENNDEVWLAGKLGTSRHD